MVFTYFIDSDSEYFKYLVRYLRCGHMKIPIDIAMDLQSEALYYQIDIDFSGMKLYKKSAACHQRNTV